MDLKEVMAKNFPSSGSFIIFLLYMGMFVAQGMLVTASRHGGSEYSYNTVTVVFMTELLKLVLSSGVYLKDNSPSSLVEAVIRGKNVLLLYFVPATLYCLYNNLSFLSLSFFDPTSYFMFMQSRLLMTGLIYQVVFKKALSPVQWGSLLLLTVGCLVHAAGSAGSADTNSPAEGDSHLATIWLGLVFILIQVLCSVFAGVYNEFLIKGKGADVNIMIQNVFMYLDSLLCNILLLGVKGDLATAFTAPALASLANPLVLALILNNAVLGIVTSLFLKKLNSILKAFASALELVLTALLSWPLLGIPLNLHTVTALVAISIAVVIYARNPVGSSLESQEKPREALEKV